ncbi:MAG: C25 family cysteine peptidase, partial [Bacteroidales bacterium]
MKTSALIFSLFIAFFSSGMAGEVSRVYYFREPLLLPHGEYHTIHLEGARLFGEPGKATMPFYPVKLLLPPGEVALSVEIEFGQEKLITGNYKLLPRQQTRPFSEGDSGIWLEDQDFYQSFEAYPSAHSSKISTHFMNGSGIALSAFIPVRYVPATGQVSYYSTVTVTVRTGPDPDAGQRNARFYPSPGNMSRLAGHVQNPEGIALYLTGRELRTTDYDYLVVTKNQYINNFDTLVRFYKPRGVLTKTVATEYIDTAMTGIDLQEKIRNYIIQEYEDHGISYVLIGGDEEVVPYRGFYCYVQSGGGYSDSGIPADLYYSALDGTWNDDGDELWGEPGEDDLYPEVAVGRLTFSSSAELQRMLH